MWNEAQQKYIDTIDGRVMVNAVAGSGKSSSTVARIKNMVDKGISPKDILAISFTKVASENLSEKLNKVGVKGVTSCTIHALAYRIVERKITKEVLKKKMMQPWAKESCIFEAYKSYTGKYDKKDFKFESISNLISIQQGFMVSPNSEEEDMILPIDLDEEFDLSDVKYYYDFYSDYKKSKGLYDFNDLIFEALGIVDNTSRGRGSRSFKYKYALIDEAQDITDLQYALVEKVTPTGNISLVGDSSQNLYNFSGSNPNILKEYDTKYENVTVINMNTNYRSLPNIIDHGNILTKYYYGKERNYVPAIPNREGEGVVLFDYYETAIEESMCTFKYIKRDIENGVPLSDIAVLYRNNNMSQYLEALLRSENIPYELSGGSSLFDNDEIKSLGAFLKVIATDFDDSSVLYDLVAMRTIGGFRITNASLNKINWYARENKCSFFMALNECDYNGRGMVLETLNKLYDIRDRFSKDSVVIRMAKSFISKFGFDKRIQELPEEEREPRVMALNLVLDSIGKMDLNNAISFISGKGKVIKEDEENDKEKITLSTIHQSKGLEWKRTYVIRFDALPSLDVYSGVNLAYVSISRAQEYLRVSAIKRNEFMDVLMGMAPEYNYDEDMYDLDKEMEDIFNKIIG